MRDALAALAHEQWVGWMKYLFSRSSRLPDGSCVIPASLVQRWDRQMATPYDHLPEPEKDSDRREADRMIDTLRRWIRDG